MVRIFERDPTSAWLWRCAARSLNLSPEEENDVYDHDCPSVRRCGWGNFRPTSTSGRCRTLQATIWSKSCSRFGKWSRSVTPAS